MDGKASKLGDNLWQYKNFELKFDPNIYRSLKAKVDIIWQWEILKNDPDLIKHQFYKDYLDWNDWYSTRRNFIPETLKEWNRKKNKGNKGSLHLKPTQNDFRNIREAHIKAAITANSSIADCNDIISAIASNGASNKRSSYNNTYYLIKKCEKEIENEMESKSEEDVDINVNERVFGDEDYLKGADAVMDISADEDTDSDEDYVCPVIDEKTDKKNQESKSSVHDGCDLKPTQEDMLKLNKPCHQCETIMDTKYWGIGCYFEDGCKFKAHYDCMVMGVDNLLYCKTHWMQMSRHTPPRVKNKKDLRCVNIIDEGRKRYYFFIYQDIQYYKVRGDKLSDVEKECIGKFEDKWSGNGFRQYEFNECKEEIPITLIQTNSDGKQFTLDRHIKRYTFGPNMAPFIRVDNFVNKEAADQFSQRMNKIYKKRKQYQNKKG